MNKTDTTSNSKQAINYDTETLAKIDSLIEFIIDEVIEDILNDSIDFTLRWLLNSDEVKLNFYNKYLKLKENAEISNNC